MVGERSFGRENLRGATISGVVDVQFTERRRILLIPYDPCSNQGFIPAR